MAPGEYTERLSKRAGLLDEPVSVPAVRVFRGWGWLNAKRDRPELSPGSSGPLPVADALSTLRSQAFKPRIVPVPSVEPAGQVVAQHPKAGTKTRPGTSVRLNVSKGKRAASTATGNTPTPTVAATTNQETTPKTRTVPASASPLVGVPDLEGKKLIDARRLMRQVGLVIEIRRVPSAEPLGTVIAQAKQPDTRLKRGTHLLVTISKGQEPPHRQHHRSRDRNRSPFRT